MSDGGWQGDETRRRGAARGPAWRAVSGGGRRTPMTAAVEQEIRYGVVLPRVTATPGVEVFSPEVTSSPGALEPVTRRTPVRTPNAVVAPPRRAPRRSRARAAALAVLASVPLVVISVRGSSGSGASPAADRAAGQSGQNPGAPAPHWPSAAPSGSPSGSPSGTPDVPPSPKGKPGGPHSSKSGASKDEHHQTRPGGGTTGSGGGGHPAVTTAGSARTIHSAASGRCISVSAHTAKDGSPLQIYDCQGARWQKWTFGSDGSVRSMGMCMDVAWGSSDDGTTIQLARCHGGAAQTFDLNSAGDLVNTGADKCVDGKDKKTANGTRLQLWQCAGTSNQKWSAL